MVTQLLEAREDRQLQRLLTQLQKQNLLILDELGYVPFSKAGTELLFEVVSRAYERQSLIITTNPAVRELDRSVWLRETDRCDAGQTDSQGSYN